MNTAIYVESGDVGTRLEALGLSDIPLRDALKYGHLHRSACTANDPPITWGIIRWGKATRALREMLTPEGWIRCDEANFSITLNPNRTMAISIQTGDDGTGCPDRIPSTKHKKGPATVAAVEQNAKQLSFNFPIQIRPTKLQRPMSKCMTWLLLASTNMNEIRCELSLPRYINDDGHVEEWAERIMLDPIPLDNEPKIRSRMEESGEDIIVPIARKIAS